MPKRSRDGGELKATIGGLDSFDLELFFAKHEFSAKYLMCCSDAESMKMKDLLALADKECKDLWEDLSCQYTESPGLPLLRQEIAKEYPGLGEDDVFCFAGAEEGIYTAMRALLSDEDHCVIVTPCYQSLKSVASAVCESFSCVDLLPENGWQLDLSALEAAIRPNTRMMVMNYPHNPTGALLTQAEQAAVVEMCKKKDLYLFFDEVYRGIEAPGTTRLPTLASLFDKGMSLGVVSKALGLAGLRVGWIACKSKAVIAALAGYKHYLSICNSAPSEILALIALRNKDQILLRNTTLTARNLQLVEAFLRQPQHAKRFSWTPPRAGCCGFMAFNRDGAYTDWEPLANAIVEADSVLTLPGKFFPCAAEPKSNHFRVGLGRANFPEVLARFQEALEKIDWDKYNLG